MSSHEHSSENGRNGWTAWIGRYPRLVYAAGLVLLFVMPFLCYIPILRSPESFIWDDNHMVYNNHLIRLDDGLRRFWFTKENFDYFPLTSTTLWPSKWQS